MLVNGIRGLTSARNRVRVNAAVTQNACTAVFLQRLTTPLRCGIVTAGTTGYGSTSCRPSLRSSRAWVAQTAVTRIIGWPGLLARVDLISSLTTAGTVLSCAKSQVSIFATGLGASLSLTAHIVCRSRGLAREAWALGGLRSGHESHDVGRVSPRVLVLSPSSSDSGVLPFSTGLSFSRGQPWPIRTRAVRRARRPRRASR